MPLTSRSKFDTNPPSVSESLESTEPLKRNFSTAEIGGTKPNSQKTEITQSPPTVKTEAIINITTIRDIKLKNVSIIPEIDQNFESDELDSYLAESNDSCHHNAPPPFIIKHAPTGITTRPTIKLPNIEEYKPKVQAYLTPRHRTPVLLANVPIFKQNISPLGEDSEDLIGIEIEFLDDGPKKDSRAKQARASHTTADNSSGCPSDVFPDSGSLLEKKDLVGPDSFVAHKLLGKGSFGEVYLVEKLGCKTLFAMKVLSKAKIMSQNLVKYALTERKVLSAVNHPFIVRLHYAFQSDSKLFLVLDYCAGGDLSEYLRKEKK